MILESAKLLHDLRVTGEDWADKQAAADALDESRKSLLASLIAAKMALGETRVSAETQAKTEKEYLDTTDSVLVAKKAAVRARVAYDLARVAVDLYRTEAATRRAELENIHGE